MSNADLIERLREIPILLRDAPVRYAKTAADECMKAADALEAAERSAVERALEINKLKICNDKLIRQRKR